MKEKKKVEPLAYSVREAAKILGMSHTWMDKHVRSGAINSVKMLGVRRVTKAEIDRILDEGIKE